MEQITDKQLSNLQTDIRRTFFILFETYKARSNNDVTSEDLCSVAKTLVATCKIPDTTQHTRIVSTGILAVNLLAEIRDSSTFGYPIKKLFESGVHKVLLSASFEALLFAEDKDLEHLAKQLFSLEKIWTSLSSNHADETKYCVETLLGEMLKRWGPSTQKIASFLRKYPDDCESVLFRSLCTYVLEKGGKREVATLLQINLSKQDDGSSRRF